MTRSFVVIVKLAAPVYFVTGVNWSVASAALMLAIVPVKSRLVLPVLPPAN